jgi:hypothetical protein
MSSAQSLSLSHESGAQYCVVALHGAQSLPSAHAISGQALGSLAHS